MKKTLIFIIALLNTIVVCQKDVIPPGSIELYLQVKSYSTLLDFSLNAVSTIYDENYELTNDPNMKSSNYEITGNYLGKSKGWDAIWSITDSIDANIEIGQGFEIFGFGLYKFSVTSLRGNEYFYLDYRDSGLPTNYNIDITIRYYAKAHEFKVFPGAATSGGPNDNSFTFIDSGEYLSIWNLKNEGISPNTSNFPRDYWNECFAIGKMDEVEPHLIWSKYPSFSNINGYYIYSGTPSNGVAPNDNNYQQIQQTGSTVYDYVDNSVGGINEIGGAPYIRLYFVKAKQGTQYSERSNIEIVFSNVNWSNALIMVNENNNPSLMWDEYKGFDAANISGYKIYRGMPSPIKPSLFIFSPIATVTKNEFKFIDHDIFLSSSSGEVRYYVKAILSQGESSATNTVPANGGLYKNSPPPRSIT